MSTKGPFRTGRLKDLITNKGPDIFAANRYRTTPNRPAWSNWREWDNLRYFDRDETSLLGLALEDPDRVYDFRTRRYKQRSPWLWSDAKRSKDGKNVYYNRAADGVEYTHGRPPGRWWNDYANWPEYPKGTIWTQHMPEDAWYEHYPWGEWGEEWPGEYHYPEHPPPPWHVPWPPYHPPAFYWEYDQVY